MQEHWAAWNDLVWSTDPIFQGEFLRLWRPAGPSGLEWRLKNRDTRIMLCTQHEWSGKQGQEDWCAPDKPWMEQEWSSHTPQCRDTCKSLVSNAHIHNRVKEEILSTLTPVYKNLDSNFGSATWISFSIVWLVFIENNMATETKCSSHKWWLAKMSEWIWTLDHYSNVWASAHEIYTLPM